MNTKRNISNLNLKISERRKSIRSGNVSNSIDNVPVSWLDARKSHSCFFKKLKKSKDFVPYNNYKKGENYYDSVRIF